MFRVIFSLFVLSLFSPALVMANNIELTLSCEIHFSKFNNIKQASTGKTIKLTGLKHQPGGVQLVAQTDDYEFWAMIHSIQTKDNKKFANNYQVAIKEKKTGLFMHALSDSVYSSKQKPKKARISLVEYYPDSFLEKGELFFECRTLK